MKQDTQDLILHEASLDSSCSFSIWGKLEFFFKEKNVKEAEHSIPERTACTKTYCKEKKFRRASKIDSL